MSNLSIPARLWVGDLGEGEVVLEDESVIVDIDSDSPTEIGLHTMINGRGSLVSYYFDREAAIGLAAEILEAVNIL